MPQEDLKVGHYTFKDRIRVSSEVYSNRTRQHAHKLRQQKLWIGVRKTCFPKRVLKQQHKLPREIVEFPSLKTVKTWS